MNNSGPTNLVGTMNSRTAPMGKPGDTETLDPSNN